MKPPISRDDVEASEHEGRIKLTHKVSFTYDPEFEETDKPTTLFLIHEQLYGDIRSHLIKVLVSLHSDPNIADNHPAIKQIQDIVINGLGGNEFAGIE